jgi:hypothetical protein
VHDPDRMVEMIRQVREMDVYTPMPIVNNEDDQPWRVEEQGWGESSNNFAAATKNYASWGYFDFRLAQEHGDFNEGFQSVPVNWHITSERKRDFFDLMADITGSPGTPKLHLDWSREAGGVTVRVEQGRSGTPLERLELLINNEVVATAAAPGTGFQVRVPDEDHWVRARARYYAGGREITVESPYYQNPWWPYGGPARAD